MRYTLKQLRYLEAAARLKSIAAAAEEFAISPSAIAAAIDGIEAEVAQPLFIRNPSKGVGLTRFGREFLKRVGIVLQSHVDFERTLSEISYNIEGSIRLGCFTPVAPIILPTVLKLVTDAHPNLSMQIVEGDVDYLTKRLAADEIDLALTLNIDVPGDLIFESLFHAWPHIALSAKHPLASRPSLTLDDLAGEPLILLNLDRTRSYMLQLFERHGLTPNILYSSRSSEMVRSLVAAGFGYGIFNVKPLTKETYGTNDLVRVPLPAHHLAPEFGILHGEQVLLTPVARAIIDACNQLKSDGAFDGFVVAPAGR